MKRVRLTVRAETHLTEILRFSIERWGAERAEAYKSQIEDRLFALASGSPPHGRSCELLVADLIDAPGLKYYREGGHYIIYRETAETLVVYDFIHQARNLEALLQDLANSQ